MNYLHYKVYDPDFKKKALESFCAFVDFGHITGDVLLIGELWVVHFILMWGVFQVECGSFTLYMYVRVHTHDALYYEWIVGYLLLYTMHTSQVDYRSSTLIHIYDVFSYKVNCESFTFTYMTPLLMGRLWIIHIYIWCILYWAHCGAFAILYCVYMYVYICVFDSLRN